jgi:uncharacterized membrane protein
MPGPSERAEHPSLARIGTFSDGVFAIGITLLVLAIRIPHPTDADADRGLLTLLTDQWRSYLAFVLSFMVVGINWANHRVMFKTFARADNTLVWLNLVYLMVAVVFIPVPTAVLGAWLGDSHNEVVAAVFYGAVGTAGGLLYILLWWYGAYAAKLTEISAQQRRALTIAWAPAPLVVALLTAVAFVSPTVAVAGYVAIVLVYVLPVPRLVALAQRPRRAQPSRRR